MYGNVLFMQWLQYSRMRLGDSLAGPLVDWLGDLLVIVRLVGGPFFFFFFAGWFVPSLRLKVHMCQVSYVPGKHTVTT